MNEKDFAFVCMDDQLKSAWKQMDLEPCQLPLLWQMRQIGCTQSECECLFDKHLPAAGRHKILLRKRCELLQDIRTKEACLDLAKDLETQLFPKEKRK